MRADYFAGGPAFPPLHDPDTHPSGMSLRDWFAGQAMSQYLRLMNKWCPQGLTDENVKEVATLSYEVADAMLQARK